MPSDVVIRNFLNITLLCETYVDIQLNIYYQRESSKLECIIAMIKITWEDRKQKKGIIICIWIWYIVRYFLYHFNAALFMTRERKFNFLAKKKN